ncbi:MAG: TPM domain-containing protein [Bacteroidetes bacterium]|nr:TPM domain-containing protein [Bacteroidota bacterium]
MKNLRLLICAFAITLCITSVNAETQIPELKQRVNDFTNILGFQEWQEVDRLLKSYEDTTSMQVVVLMINSLDGESIDNFADKTFAQNKIGLEKQDNGVLLLIVKADMTVKIQAGRNLENILTGAITSQIIQNEIMPHLEANNYFGGVVTGADAIVRAAKGDYELAETDNTTLLIIAIAAVVMVILAISLLLKRKNKTQVKKPE